MQKVFHFGKLLENFHGKSFLDYTLEIACKDIQKKRLAYSSDIKKAEKFSALNLVKI